MPFNDEDIYVHILKIWCRFLYKYTKSKLAYFFVRNYSLGLSHSGQNII